MADGRDSWRNGPEAAQLRREFREEARKLRDELREEWMFQMAQQAEAMRSQREAREFHHGGQRRGPGRPRGNLSRDAIVDVAMKIMSKRGLDKVTMRAIAHELNTGPASLYAYVTSMAELHGHMLDRIIGEIDLTRGRGDWRARLTRMLHDLSTELLKYPDLARSALEVRPMGANTLRLADAAMGLLAEGGIPPRNRALGLDLIMLWTMGGAAEHAADATDHGATSEIIEAFHSAVEDKDRYPHLHAVREDLFFGTEEQRFAWGVESLLAGIAAIPAPTD